MPCDCKAMNLKRVGDFSDIISPIYERAPRFEIRQSKTWTLTRNQTDFQRSRLHMQ